MLSIVNAAEMQFRYETESRGREHALLASIRERRAAETARVADVVAAPARLATLDEARRVAPRAARASWPRPIGIDTCSTAACAVA